MTPRKFCATALAALAVGIAGPAAAQSTDAYHSIQIFPVVVDTASFAQRFSFKNPTGLPITIEPRYFPAAGVTPATPLTCPAFQVASLKTATFTSLRQMCPDLPAGSQFGFLHTGLQGNGFLPYAGFSRVSNPQGNGFSVEAFSAQAFTSADLSVNGIRRLAATPTSPSFQTNCFIGSINALDPDYAPITTPVKYTLLNSAGVFIAQATVSVGTGQMVRLLDVFAIAPPGDYNDAQVRFEEMGPNEPGVIAFCTVQDNTSFGADFRIAKQEYADGSEAAPTRTVGPQDNTARRFVLINHDALGRPFEIDAGNSSNTHVLYTRQPDSGYCEIIDPNTGVRALPAYGLEIRSVSDGDTGAGGNDSVVVPDPLKGNSNYFGDKEGDGANGRTVFEVESNEQNTGVARPYSLLCRSGSGTTLGDILRYKENVDRF